VGHDATFQSAQQFLVVTLVVKLAVVATLATMLVRFRRFRSILIFERRDWSERLVFVGALGLPLAAGVVARLLLNYNAADLSLSGAFMAGLIAGPYAGAIVGTMVGLPALAGGEFIALPFAVGCGFAGGGLREVCPKETIWHFSPFVFTGLHRYAWRVLRRFEVDWQIILIAAPIGLELLRQGLGFRFGALRLFYLGDGTVLGTSLSVLATVLCVAIPIKIWNSARVEHKLQEQEKLLMTARIEALASQINPHFLFNTLASIGTLIRTDPETARMLLVRLSGLLRRLLRSQDHFVTLREELASIDEYLDIECVRFGPQLTVRKEIAAETTHVLVPSMILQPLVENSIKHGLSRKVGGGEITIRSRRSATGTTIEVIDNGLGIREAATSPEESSGIGLRNVRERLSVIYGSSAHLHLDSEPGRGTCARIDIPDLIERERITA
jgi:two-component system LytT family sensor kinase